MSPDGAGQDRPRWVFREEQTTGYTPGAVAVTHAALRDAVGAEITAFWDRGLTFEEVADIADREGPGDPLPEGFRDLTPEAHAALDLRQAELAEMADIEAIGRRFGETVTRCEDMTLRMVARFHGPDGGRTPDCEGCDDDEQYSPGVDWPCATFRMIEASVNPEAPERADERAKAYDLYGALAAVEPLDALGDEPGPDAHHGG